MCWCLSRLTHVLKCFSDFSWIGWRPLVKFYRFREKTNDCISEGNEMNIHKRYGSEGTEMNIRNHCGCDGNEMNTHNQPTILKVTKETNSIMSFYTLVFKLGRDKTTQRAVICIVHVSHMHFWSLNCLRCLARVALALKFIGPYANSSDRRKELLTESWTIYESFS